MYDAVMRARKKRNIVSLIVDSVLFGINGLCVLYCIYRVVSVVFDSDQSNEWVDPALQLLTNIDAMTSIYILSHNQRCGMARMLLPHPLDS